MSARRAVLGLGAGNGLLTAANLLRDVTIASVIGATATADYFFLVISIPVFLLTVSGGSFRSMAVPILERIAQNSRMVALQAGSELIRRGAMGIGLASLSLIAIALAGSTVDRLFAVLLAAVVPMYALAAYIELSQGPLQLVDRYLLPSILKIGLPLGMALGLWVLGVKWDVFAAVGGGLVGAAVAAGAAYLLLRRSGLSGTRRGASGAAELGSAGVNFRALVVATTITYANPLIDQWVASLAGPGAVSQLGYASRISVGVASLVAGSVAPVLLSSLSRRIGRGDERGVRGLYMLAVSAGAWSGAIASLGLWIFGDLLVDMLYVRGQFGAADREIVARLVAIYSLQFPFYWASVAAFTYISANTLNRFFVVLGVTLFVVNLAGDIVLIERFGVYGIAVSTVIVYALSLVMMNLFLASRRRIQIAKRDVGRVLLPVVLLAIAIAVIDGYSQAQESLWPTTSALTAFILFVSLGMVILWSAYHRYVADEGR